MVPEAILSGSYAREKVPRIYPPADIRRQQDRQISTSYRQGAFSASWYYAHIGDRFMVEEQTLVVVHASKLIPAPPCLSVTEST